MRHQDHIEKYAGSLTELAEDIGNLKYDALAELLRLLSVKIAEDAAKDQERGRPQLASALQDCAQKLKGASAPIEAVWRISKPYMTDG